jgi:membrane associated rhomboid family serine protease
VQLPPRWQWKINRIRQQWAERMDHARTLADTAQNQQRMCPECRALVDRGYDRCPLCGSPMHTVAHGVVGRAAEILLPARGRVTAFINLANGLLFLLTLLVSIQSMDGQLGLGLLLGGIDPVVLLRYGAKWGPFIAQGDWWRLVAPIFLHGGVLHLAMNTWVLLDLGPAVEELYGRAKFTVFYVLTGIGGVAASFLWKPAVVSIGASGAICGLIGLLLGRTYQYHGTHPSPERSMLMSWVVRILILSLLPMIDMAAHVGGLLVGLALGYVVSDLPAERGENPALWRALQVAVILLVAVSFLMTGLRPRV